MAPQIFQIVAREKGGIGGFAFAPSLSGADTKAAASCGRRPTTTPSSAIVSPAARVCVCAFAAQPSARGQIKGG